MPNKLSLLKDFVSAHRGSIGFVAGMNFGSYLTVKSIERTIKRNEIAKEEENYAALTYDYDKLFSR